MAVLIMPFAFINVLILAVLQCYSISNSNYFLHNVVVYSLCGWLLLPNLCATWN